MELKREKINHWECVSLSGPFIVKSTDEVHSIIGEVSSSESPFLAVDLTDVPFMDSSAIGVLLSGSKTMVKQNGRLVIYGANDVIMDVFRAVQLPNHIPVYANRDDFLHHNM